MSRSKFRSSHLPFRRTARVIVVDPNGFVLIGEARDYDGIWKFPGGGLRKNETHRHAAGRELREETGLRRLKYDREFAGPIFAAIR